MKLKLGIIVPSNNPLAYASLFGESVRHLLPLAKPYEVRILLCAQAPWTERAIAAAQERSPIPLMACRAPVNRPPHIIDLRHRCADLWRDADVYMFSDDNMQFVAEGTPCYAGGSAERYDQCLHYLATFDKCGILMCEGSLGGSVQKLQIRRHLKGIVATQRGLFFRNLDQPYGLYTKRERALIGGWGESVLAMRTLAHGYFFAKQFNNPTRHRTTKYHAVTDTNHMAHPSVVEANARAYIRECYNDPEWTHHQGRFPKTVQVFPSTDLFPMEF